MQSSCVAGVLAIHGNKTPTLRWALGLHQTIRNQLTPATFDPEYGSATSADPYASTVVAPGTTLDACGIRNLALNTHAAATSRINLTHPIAVVLTLTGEADILIPVITWLPAAVVGTAVTATATTLDEDPATAAINPKAAAVNAPSAPFDALRFRRLSNDIGLAPVDTAPGVSVILARTFDSVVATILSAVTVTALRISVCGRHHH